MDPEHLQGLISRSQGRALPKAVASTLSSRLGVDLSAARIHTDAAAAQAAEEVNAYAFAVGEDVFFGAGNYKPGTPEGDHLIVHELTHVAQHLEGRLRSGPGMSVSSPSDATELEAEATAHELAPAVDLTATAAAVPAPSLAAPSGPESVAEAGAVSRSENEETSKDGGDSGDLSAVLNAAFQESEDELAIQEEEEEALFLESQAAAEQEQYDEDPLQEEPALEQAPAEPVADAPPAEPLANPIDPRAALPGAEPPSVPDLSGGDPTQVAAQYRALTPSQMAKAQPTLSQSLQTGTEAVRRSVVDATSDLQASQQGVESLPQSATVDTAGPPAAVAQLDETPAQVTVQEAPEEQVVDDIDLTAAFSGASGADPQASAGAIGAALSAVSTAQTNVDTRLTTPVIPLEGAADPAQLGSVARDAAVEAGDALAQALAGVDALPVTTLVQPLAMDQTVALPDVPALEALPEAPSVQGMMQLEGFALGAPDQAAFDDAYGDEMQASLDGATAQIETAQGSLDTEHASLLTDSEAERSELTIDAQQRQTDAVAKAQADMGAAQQDVRAKQQAAVDGAMGQMESERQASMSQIDSRVAADRATIDDTYATATAKADATVSQAESAAAQAQSEAQTEAESDSWWDRAIDAWQAAVQSLADLVTRIWEAVTAAVAEILDAAVALATAMVQALVSYVTELLAAYFDLWKGLIQELFGDIFPGLADLLCEAVDAVQAVVVDLLHTAADAFVAALETLAAGVVAALNGLLVAFQAAVATYLSALESIQQGEWRDVGRMILTALLTAVGIDPAQFFQVFANIDEIIDEVIANPGSIAKNAGDAIGKGFTQFGDNFLEHFIAGSVEWLTGAADIQMPDTFDIAGIFDVACQVLGLTYEHLREKAVEHVGEGGVTAVETLYEGIMEFVEGGWSGLWEYVKDGLVSLVDDVVVAIGTWLVEKAILVAGRWIAGLAATMGLSSILEALIAAWQLMMWCIDQFTAMYQIVQSTVESVHDFVFGNIQPAADKIENTLADFIPPAIDLVAKLLNISNIADKVQEIIEGTRGMIDEAIDAVFVTLKSTLGIGGDEEDAGDEAVSFEERRFTLTGDDGKEEQHRLFYEVHDDNATMMMASVIGPVEDHAELTTEQKLAVSGLVNEGENDAELALKEHDERKESEAQTELGQVVTALGGSGDEGGERTLLAWLQAKGTATSIDPGLSGALEQKTTSLPETADVADAEQEIRIARSSLDNPFNMASKVNTSLYNSVEKLSASSTGTDGVAVTRTLREYKDALATDIKGKLASDVRTPVIAGPVLESASPTLSNRDSEWKALETWLSDPALQVQSPTNYDARWDFYVTLDTHYGAGVHTPKPSPVTESAAKKYREDIQTAAIEKMTEDVAEFHTNVVCASILDGEAGLKGAFFEKWLQRYYKTIYSRKGRPSFLLENADKTTTRVVADGFVEGSSQNPEGATLYDAKAYQPGTAPDTAGMLRYKGVLGEPCLKTPGMTPMKFTKMRYVFSSIETANAWWPDLSKVFEGKVEVFVGGGDVTDSLNAIITADEASSAESL